MEQNFGRCTLSIVKIKQEFEALDNAFFKFKWWTFDYIAWTYPSTQ